MAVELGWDRVIPTFATREVSRDTRSYVKSRVGIHKPRSAKIIQR